MTPAQLVRRNSSDHHIGANVHCGNILPPRCLVCDCSASVLLIIVARPPLVNTSTVIGRPVNHVTKFRAMIALQRGNLHASLGLFNKFGHVGHVSRSECPLVAQSGVRIMAQDVRDVVAIASTELVGDSSVSVALCLRRSEGHGSNGSLKRSIHEAILKSPSVDGVFFVSTFCGLTPNGKTCAVDESTLSRDFGESFGASAHAVARVCVQYNGICSCAAFPMETCSSGDGPHDFALDPRGTLELANRAIGTLERSVVPGKSDGTGESNTRREHARVDPRDSEELPADGGKVATEVYPSYLGTTYFASERTGMLPQLVNCFHV